MHLTLHISFTNIDTSICNIIGTINLQIIINILVILLLIISVHAVKTNDYTKVCLNG